MPTRSLSVKVAVLGGLALAIVFAIGMTVLMQMVGSTIERQTHDLQAATTEAVASAVAADLSDAARAADGIVTALEALHASGAVDRKVYDATLTRFLDRNPGLLGAWSGWEPNALDGKDADFANTPGSDASGRYVPYFNRGSGSVALEPLLDYDKPGPGDYYQLPKSLDRAVAIEPYTYSIAGKDTLIMSFGSPIKADGKYVGTGGVDLTLANVNAKLAELKPFGTGHVAVVTGSGIVVAHPDPTQIGKTLDPADPMAQLVASAGYICGVFPNAERVALYFEHGRLLSAVDELPLGQDLKRGRYTIFKPGEDIPIDTIGILVTEAIALFR